MNCASASQDILSIEKVLCKICNNDLVFADAVPGLSRGAKGGGCDGCGMWRMWTVNGDGTLSGRRWRSGLVRAIR